MFKGNNEVRLHIGFHKTATTHLQDTLALLKDELSEEGIRVIPRKGFRKKFTALTHYSLLKKYRLELLKYRKLCSFLFEKDAELTLISEENILGNLAHIMSIRPLEKTDLEFINILSKHKKVTVYLSVRPFDQIYSSAYCSLLKYNPRVSLGVKKDLIEQLEEGALPSWFDIIARLQSRLPGITIKVWEYKDYRTHPEAVISEFAGHSIEVLPAMEVPQDTKSPNKAAISLVEKMIINEEHLNDSEWFRNIGKVYSMNKVESNQDKFSLLDSEKNDRLQAKYNEDMQKLEKLSKVTLLSFEE